MKTKNINKRIRKRVKLGLLIAATAILSQGCFMSIGGDDADKEVENVCAGVSNEFVNSTAAQCEAAGGYWNSESGCYCSDE